MIDRAAAIPRRFLVAALWCTLTMGATFVAYNLLFVHLSLGVNPPIHNWVHASFQVLGFVLLLSMGISYDVIPKLLGQPLTRPRLARATLPMTLGALMLRSYGQLGALVPSAPTALLLGEALVAAAVAAWAFVLFESSGGVEAWLDLPRRFVARAVAWWLVSMVKILTTLRGSRHTRASETPRRQGAAVPLVDRDAVLRILGTVLDPGLDKSVVELGWVRDAEVASDGRVRVRMTPPSPSCPHASRLADDVRFAVGILPGVVSVDVDVDREEERHPSVLEKQDARP